MKNHLAGALKLAGEIRSDVTKYSLPPAEGAAAPGEAVLYFSLIRGTRGYLEKITHQINGCYSHGWYDGSSVMIRRLIEALIIESFEAHGISPKIKDANGDYLFLRDLISHALTETSWSLGRATKQALPLLKDVGDKSAHSRRFTAHRQDIDNLIPKLRIVVQELVYLAKLK